jgi:hypothetical protein
LRTAHDGQRMGRCRLPVIVVLLRVYWVLLLVFTYIWLAVACVALECHRCAHD